MPLRRAPERGDWSQTLSALTSGSDNMALGYRAPIRHYRYCEHFGRLNVLSSATAPGSSVAVGYYAMANVHGTGTITGVTAVGRSAGYATTGHTEPSSVVTPDSGQRLALTTFTSVVSPATTDHTIQRAHHQLQSTARTARVTWASSIIYGVRDAVAANQTLALNAAVMATYGLTSPTSVTALRFLSGTLTYSAANAFGALQQSTNGYAQFVIQNSNSGTTASADFVVNNDLSTGHHVLR